MNIFKAKLPIYSEPKNKFDLSHERKQSTQWGRLDPILNIEVVPGDRFRISSELFGRWAPMLAPIMHRADVYVHYFFVPYRLVWNRWNDFITGSLDNGPAPLEVPKVTHAPGALTFDGYGRIGGLVDLMGLSYGESPTNGLKAPLISEFSYSQLPFRCYQEIYNEWYRDQTIIPKIAYDKGSNDLELSDQSAPNIALLDALLNPRQRAWEKDYFTTALPNPQFGTQQAAVPVRTDFARNEITGGPAAAGNVTTDALGNLQVGVVDAQLEGEMLINELRKANALQLWLEKTARSGQRIAEMILQHFGVEISDLRAQKPEYLGGGKQHMKISEVLSTYDNTAGDNPQGTFTGHGITSGDHFGFDRTFEEHGQLIAIMSVIPKPGYQQQFPRQFSRTDKYSFYWPSFANLGEQEVKNKELFCKPDNPADNELTFGYQSRYAEYKYIPNTSHGDFKTTLQYWHLDKVYDPTGATPALNQQFIEVNPQDSGNAGDDLNRIFTDVSRWNDKMWFQIYHNIDALRPMPVHSIPRL